MVRRVEPSYCRRVKTTPSPCDESLIDVGDFYVEPDCCMLCGVPENIAPEVFQSGERHCFVKRQPRSRDELDRTIRAMSLAEVDCIRYRGQDVRLLERLARAGMAGQADHPHWLDAPVALRDHVRFTMRLDASVRPTAVQVAHALRTNERRRGARVLPALFGRQTVWVSWYRFRFHGVHIADEGDGKFVAHLRTRVALRVLAWSVDDWLRKRGAEDICWQARGDPTSASPTPM